MAGKNGTNFGWLVGVRHLIEIVRVVLMMVYRWSVIVVDDDHSE